MQNRLAFLRLIGFVLLAGLVIWIGVSVMHGVSRESPKLLDDGHAFEGNTQLPVAEIQKQLTAARERMDARYQYSQWARYAGIGGISADCPDNAYCRLSWPFARGRASERPEHRGSGEGPLGSIHTRRWACRCRCGYIHRPFGQG
jgi:hypothetical protein